MTRVSRLLHLDDGEFPALRAQIEAKPLRVGIHEPLAPLPPGAPARAVAGLAELRAADPTLGMRRPSVPSTPRPIVLTDWSARLADDWTHIADRHDNFAKAIEREFINFGFAVEYTSRALVSPLLAEVADLTKSRLPEWRRALAMHAEAELALCDAELAVAL